MHDLIIIGQGPAGITAAIYAARKKMNFIIIGKTLGGQAVWSSGVENYTGFKFIAGADLMLKFKEHMDNFKIDLRENEEARLVKKSGEIITVETNRNKYEAKSVIIASGKTPRKLDAPGEAQFINKGVAYCATCDGPLFAGSDVAVIGGGNSALDAALQMIKIAKKVYLVNRGSQIKAEPVMAEKFKSAGNAVIYNNATVEKIFGGKFVEGITVKVDDKTEDIAVEGVFVEIGYVPSSSFAQDIEKNNDGEILVNCRCETNIPGIFAAGDVTNVPAKQIIVACGEGAKASVAAFEYISRKK